VGRVQTRQTDRDEICRGMCVYTLGWVDDLMCSECSTHWLCEAGCVCKCWQMLGVQCMCVWLSVYRKDLGRTLFTW